MPASIWQGIATLIRQTPNQCRQDVAEFLRVLSADLGGDSALYVFMGEVINAIQTNPYDGVPETPVTTFDFAW